MNPNIYNINYGRLVVWLLPNALRKTRLIAYIEALIKPVTSAYLAFRHYRNARLYELAITPQVCYLEKMLNDRYDPLQRRICIVDSVDQDPQHIYLAAENKPVYLGVKTIYTMGETSILYPFDFFVQVPVVLQGTFQVPEMLQLVNTYKLAGMRPVIQYV